MKRHVNVLAVVLFLVALAAMIAAVRIGLPVRASTGFFGGA